MEEWRLRVLDEKIWCLRTTKPPYSEEEILSHLRWFAESNFPDLTKDDIDRYLSMRGLL